MQSLPFILVYSFFCCCDQLEYYGISFSAALSVDFVLGFFWRGGCGGGLVLYFSDIVTVRCLYHEVPTCKSTLMSHQGPVSAPALG